jgi:hypothetical protein
VVTGLVPVVGWVMVVFGLMAINDAKQLVGSKVGEELGHP